jgi:2-dehydro-3-deoxyphosphogluconate aldolase / (4S)-4-hydroxy-2-oxoglutarate aldolase
MDKILENIGKYRIVPVIVIDDAGNSIPLSQALIESGLPVAEVTFRTDAAKGSIEKIAKTFPEMYLGAGTVLTVEQVKSAVDVGAKFIVSPGFNTKVVEYCCANNIPITPGVATPTEIQMAMEFDLEVVKFFPAEPLGGVNYLKAISAPYNNLRFIPTGGIDEKNIITYLQFPKVLACGGSWMVKSDLIKNRKFNEIKDLTIEALKVVKGIK